MTEPVVMILTSCGRMGNTDTKTGFYWEELAVPYYTLRDAGHAVDIASIKGGMPPADPSSDPGKGERPEAVQRFLDDREAMGKLRETIPLAEVDPSRYGAVFLPGGHGTMWDFAQTKALGQTVAKVFDQGGAVGAVCHGPAGLVEATLADGTPLVKGREVGGFSNSEEEQAGLTDVVPFLLEDALKEKGGDYRKGDDFAAFAVRDGRLVTGQNPASSQRAAELLIEAMAEARAVETAD